MYKITGKQKFGAVHHGGECIAVFEKGVAYTDDPENAEILRGMGYTVEGEADQEDDAFAAAVDSESVDAEAMAAEVPEEVPEMMGVNTKRTRGKKGE